jgi:hypothetical protein
MSQIKGEFIHLSLELDRSGLVWHPEIGDEISPKPTLEKVSILVDPYGLSPKELRNQYLWLPTLEQLVEQLEAREAMIFHAGVTKTFSYEAVVKTGTGVVEKTAPDLRFAFAKVLKEILANSGQTKFQ